LKLGLAALSGKKAQRSGRAPYHDDVAARLITATLRARVVEAVAHDPAAVVMVATDAIYTTRPLPLDAGEGLGQWKPTIWPDLFIAQPGIYWSPTKLAQAAEAGPAELAELVKTTMKSRGAPRSAVGDAAPQFVRAFDDWIAKLHNAVGADAAGDKQAEDLAAMLADRKNIPKVAVTIRDVFHGCALALARGKPSLAGTWKDVTRKFSFDWINKRHATWGVRLDGNSIRTMPISQSKLDESEGYEPIDFDRPAEIVDAKGRTVTIAEDVLFEAMPDHVQWLPHEE
jgi:hypothetical protein